MRTLEGIDTRSKNQSISTELMKLEDMRTLEGIYTGKELGATSPCLMLEDMRTLEGIDTNH